MKNLWKRQKIMIIQQEHCLKSVQILIFGHYSHSGNLLDYLYHQNYYKLIGIDLSRQANTTIPQKINFAEKLDEDNGVTMFFVSKKQQKTVPNFSLDSFIVTE